MAGASRYLTRGELKALIKIGDIMAPANKPFPSFSETGCIRHVDDIVSYLDRHDLASLKMGLGLLSVMPSCALVLFVRFIHSDFSWPNFIARNVRLVRLGLRGLVWGLYYSNNTDPSYSGVKPHEAIGYRVQCITED